MPRQTLSKSAALTQAARRGDRQRLVRALNEGADPKAEGSIALLIAAQQGHADCVEVLIPVADPLAGNSFALRLAAGHGHPDCVSLLIPVSDPKAHGSIALRLAALNAHAECVKRLLPVSDLQACGEDGLDAAAAARSNGHADIAAMIDALVEAHEIALSALPPMPSSRSARPL